MEIKMLKRQARPEGVREPGQRIEVAEGEGYALIEAGAATQVGAPVQPESVETVDHGPAPENASARTGQGRRRGRSKG